MRFQDLIPTIRKMQYEFSVSNIEGREATHLLLGQNEYRVFRHFCYNECMIGRADVAVMSETFCGMTVCSVNTESLIAVCRPTILPRKPCKACHP